MAEGKLANNTIKIDVTSGNTVNLVQASNSMAKYYSDLAQNSATKAQESANLAKEKTEECEETYIKVQESADSTIKSIKSQEEVSLQNLSEQETASLDNINTLKTSAISEIKEQNSASLEEIETKTTASINTLTGYVETAQNASENAENFAKNAESSASAASLSENNAENSAENAVAQAEIATLKAAAASKSSNAANISAENAKVSETNAANSAASAKTSAASAASSAESAAEQAEIAVNNANKTEEYLQEAKNWATKTDSAVEGELYSAKYYAEQAKTMISSGLTQATESTLGAAKIATKNETAAMSDDTKIVTPLKLGSVINSIKSLKADKATTLSGYGISDAKISDGVITLGSNSITPLTSSSTLNAAKLSGTASISTTGDAVYATSGVKSYKAFTSSSGFEEAGTVGSLTSELTKEGIQLATSYCAANSPTTYGNVIGVRGQGAGELFLGWSGTDSTTEKLYYRSHRDTETGGWGEWKTIAYTSDIPNVSNTYSSTSSDAMSGNAVASAISTIQTQLNNKANAALSNITEAGKEVIKDLAGGSLPIGTVIPLVCSSSYVPEGCLPCDGSEYSQTQFTNLWSNYLTASTPLLSVCTYEEYASDITTYGQCAKFAVDTTNKKFKVPTIKDGAVIQQASSDTELGKSYNAGLPNITGSYLSYGGGEQLTNLTGAFKETYNSSWGYAHSANSQYSALHVNFDASDSNSIYGNSDTVQMNAVALCYFVVVANGTINDSQMDWSEWTSSLQGKLNADGTNLATSIGTSGVRAVTQAYVNGTSWYRVWSDGWIEQGGVISASTTTLLKEYSDTNYSIFLGYTAGIDGCWCTGGKTTTTFTQYTKYYGINKAASSTANYWYACGY